MNRLAHQLPLFRSARDPRHKLGQLSMLDRERAMGRESYFWNNLAMVEQASIGDLFVVHILSSSWSAGAPDAAPKRSVQYRIRGIPQWCPDYDSTQALAVEVMPEPGQPRLRPARLKVRPFNRSIILVNRNADGHLTTGHWVRVTPASHDTKVARLSVVEPIS